MFQPDLATLNKVKAFHAALGQAIKTSAVPVSSAVELHAQLGNMLGSSDPAAINWQQVWDVLLAILQAVIPILVPPAPTP